MEEIIKLIEDLGLEPIAVRIPSHSDWDIDKIYINNTPESIAYRRIKSIANTDINKVDFNKVIKCLSEDVETIYNCIKSNNIKYPNELKEFVENCCGIFESWDERYRQAFNAIKEYRDNVKTEKSIDEMDADELREYIRKHSIK